MIGAFVLICTKAEKPWYVQTMKSFDMYKQRYAVANGSNIRKANSDTCILGCTYFDISKSFTSEPFKQFLLMQNDMREISNF